MERLRNISAIKTIKVGMINADNINPRTGYYANSHGYYYGALMAHHDLEEFHNDSFGRGQACYPHLYSNSDELVVPIVEGFEITRFWDGDIKQAENMVRLFNKKNGIACSTVEQASEDVDLVFIADSIGDGADHLKRAIPALEKGIPVFVDKPFANDYEDAKKMVEMAEKFDAPLFSSSLVPYTPAAINFRKRFGEIGVPQFAVFKGSYFHSISLVQAFFGTGVKSVCCMPELDCMGWEPLSHFHLEYEDKDNQPKAGVMVCCASGDHHQGCMYVSLYSGKGVIHSPGIGNSEHPFGAVKILEMIKEMVKTRKSPLSYEKMLEPIAIVDACRLAKETGKQVFLKDIFN